MKNDQKRKTGWGGQGQEADLTPDEDHNTVQGTRYDKIQLISYFLFNFETSCNFYSANMSY